MKQVIDENVKSREGAAREAEHLVESGAAEFMFQIRALSATSTLKQFRGQVEDIRDTEVEKALRVIRNGGDPEAALKGLARGLTNKIIHSPTVQVRKASAEGRVEVTDWLRELFELPTSKQDSSTADKH